MADAGSAPPADAGSAVQIPVRKARPILPRVAAGSAIIALSVFAAAEMRRPSEPRLRWTPLTRATRVHTNLPLSSDGRFVYWTEYDEQGCRPLRVPLEGGDPLPVPMPFPNAFVLDARRGASLLLNVRENCKNLDVEGAVWTLDSETGLTRRVGDLTAQTGSYSRDGRSIALGRGRELWVARRDGSDAKRIAVTDGLIYFTRWSPDDTRIRYSSAMSDPVGAFQLKEIDSDGRNSRSLAMVADAAKMVGASSRWGGDWSAAADGFVYELTYEGVTDLWRMRNTGWLPRTEQPEQLTAGPLDFGSPVGIPERRELVVTGTRRHGILQRYDSALGRFVPFLNGISAEMVDFSRDGKWLVYVTFPEMQLWRSRSDGSQAVQLTQPPLRTGLPRIAPDGTQVAFSGRLPGGGWRLYLVPFAGGTPRLITASGSLGEVAPTWSSDGTRLLFRSDNSGSLLYNNDLRILDLASRRLFPIPDSRLRFNQRWSPEGNLIVATPNDENELDLYDPASGRWSVLARMRADYPSWSADGQFVYYVSHTEEHGASIYRVSVKTRRPEFVATLKGSERLIDDSWGQWAGVTPDGSPLIVANADLQQIYLLSFGSQ